MAVKEKEETAVEVDVSKLNVYQRLAAVRQEFYEIGTKKSGVNPHAEFLYFELKDIVPIAQTLFRKYHLLLLTNFENDIATAFVINTDNSAETLIFNIPFVLISEPAKFRMNEVQGVGAAVTYYRRYLYMVVLDMVENDEIDCQDGKRNLTESKKPATPDERKAIKEELTSEDGQASEEEITELKGLLKKMLEYDESNEEFIGQVAMKTENFTNLKKSLCASLVSNVKTILQGYEEG